MLVKVHEFNHSCIWGHWMDPFAELWLYFLIEVLKLYRDIQISHTITTTYLMLWKFLSYSQDSSDLSRHGLKDLWGCPEDSGTRAFCSGSSGSYMLGGGASMDQTFSSTSYRCSIRVGYGELGGPADTLGLLLCSASCSWAVFAVCQGTLSCWGIHCHLVALLWWGECTWSTTVFRWVVYFKRHPHECHQPRFPSRILHCDEMISVSHVTCQWF